MRLFLVSIVFVLYSFVWFQGKDKVVWSDFYLSPAMPAPVIEICSGFAKNMASFGLFVKTGIFMGGELKGVDERKYAESLAQNFDVTTNIYPDFVDPYYYTQSFLPHILPKYAEKTNLILERAIVEFPQNYYFPFFQGFNNYKYLSKPIEAAQLFNKASNLPDAPSLLRSLSSKLMGRGGHLKAGREMLYVLYKNEEIESVKERYRNEIVNLNKAIMVQEALERYRRIQNRDAQTLDDLIPEFLPSLPSFEYGYYLKWEPPVLSLQQPWE